MTCYVHGSHRPAVLRPETHHIQPRGMGGPDVETNRVSICPTGHVNVHVVLAALVFGKPVPKSTQKERELAQIGFDRWIEAGKPGSPHAAFGLAHEGSPAVP